MMRAALAAVILLCTPLATLDAQSHALAPYTPNVQAAALANGINLGIAPQQSYGTPPHAVISGPDHAALGDLVVLTSQGSQADAGGIRWVLVGSPKQFLQFGDQMVFASGTPGPYNFVLIAVGSVNGQVQVDTAAKILTIDGGPVPVPPGPTPIPPTPVPPLPPAIPDGRFKLGMFSYNQFKTLPNALWTLANGIAANFDATAAAATAGTLATQADMQSDIANRNIALEGANRAAYAPFFQALGSQVQTLAAAGAIKTAPDLVDAFKEISTGLKAVQP